MPHAFEDTILVRWRILVKSTFNYAICDLNDKLLSKMTPIFSSTYGIAFSLGNMGVGYCTIGFYVK